jgi:hypothetical protein
MPSRTGARSRAPAWGWGRLKGPSSHQRPTVRASAWRVSHDRSVRFAVSQYVVASATSHSRGPGTTRAEEPAAVVR